MGYGPRSTFARVVLPQLRPAILGGLLLVGLHVLAEFGGLQMLRFRMSACADVAGMRGSAVACAVPCAWFDSAHRGLWR
jgi:ABC-type sulfate transport system permease component